MLKGVFRLIIKGVVVIMPVILVVAYLNKRPFYYMDSEYPCWQQHKDFIKSDRNYWDIIVIGDSRANASFVPECLSDDLYNLALGGASPIEMYYTMETYLETHKPPSVVFVAFGDFHLSTPDCFWDRNMYFHYMSISQEADFFKTISGKQDDYFLPEDYVEKWAEYRLRLPKYYVPALINSGLTNRFDSNSTEYELAASNRGRYIIRTNDHSDKVTFEGYWDEFVINDICDLYMNKLIELLSENGVDVIVERLPFNQATIDCMSPTVKNQIEDYYKMLQSKYADLSVNCSVYSYANKYFGDESHVNELGAKIFSEYVRDKYSYVFEKSKDY